MLCEIFTWLDARALLGVRAEEWACASVLDRSVPWCYRPFWFPAVRQQASQPFPSSPQSRNYLCIVLLFSEFCAGLSYSEAVLRPPTAWSVCSSRALLGLGQLLETWYLPVLRLGSEVWVSGPGSKTYLQFLLFSLFSLFLGRVEGLTFLLSEIYFSLGFGCFPLYYCLLHFAGKKGF